MSNEIQKEPAQSTEIIDVYLLAATQEEVMCKTITKYLKPVIRYSKIPIEVHSDFDIPPGHDIEAYKERLYESEIVIIFISADYFYSDDCYQREPKVIERYNKKETILIPVLARNCLWKETPFINLPLVPQNLQPINNKQYWNSEDDDLTAVATEISKAIKKFTKSDLKNDQ